MLLHLLKNIADLPVTADMVKQSGLGKLVGSIEKHRICSGPNAGNIQERVDVVKSSWKASVKAHKIAEGTSQPKMTVVSKREAPSSSDPQSPTPKRTKVTDSSPKQSFSSLLQKLSGSSATPSSTSDSKSNQNQSNNGVKVESAKTNWKASNASSPQAVPKKKKPSARVKWADHFGGELADARLIEGENVVSEAQPSTESWSDRKKRDREKEKKLLLTMK